MNIASVYADGGVIQKNPSPIGGTWAYCHINDSGLLIKCECGVILPALWRVPSISNNFTECYALAMALTPLPNGWSGRVCSDSAIALGRFFSGWKWNNVPDELREWCQAQATRMGQIEAILHDGHPTKVQLLSGKGKRGNIVSEWNVLCDTKCGQAAAAYMEGRDL